MLRAFEFALCSSHNAVPSVVYCTFQFHSNTFAATAYDQHTHTYVLAHMYIYICIYIHFNNDLTCTDIFRIISTWPRYIYPMQFTYMDAYYLCLVVFLLFRCTNIQYGVFIFGRITYTHIRYVSRRYFCYRYTNYVIALLVVPNMFITTYAPMYYARLVVLFDAIVPNIFITTHGWTYFIYLVVLLIYFVSTFGASSSKEAIRRKYPLIVLVNR